LTGTYPSPDIAPGAIVNADVNAAAGIVYSKLILTNSIQNGDIVANAITTSKVANGTVTTSKLADSAVSGLKLLTNAVTGNHILNGTITGVDISSGTFTTTNTTFELANNDNTARELRMLEPSGSGVNYSAFKAQAQAGDITYTLPLANGTAGQVLRVAASPAPTATAATLEWATPSGGGSAPVFAKRTTSIAVNSSSPTYVDVISVSLANNTTYYIKAIVYANRSGANPTTGTARLHYSGTATTEFGMTHNSTLISGTTFNNSANYDSETNGSSNTFQATTGQEVTIEGHMTTTSAGTLTIQVARMSTNLTENITVREGTHLLATPLN
jgi:hypothetical protein